VLKFKGNWRFKPPPDGKRINQTIPSSVIGEFYALIAKIATQGNQKAVLEHFKSAFYRVKGTQYSRSTSLGWAETDLLSSMEGAGDNAPLFLEAFYDACVTFSSNNPDLFVPDVEIINAVCAENNLGYEIHPPDLILLEDETISSPQINLGRDIIAPSEISQINVYNFYSQPSKPSLKKISLKIFLCHSSSDKPKVRELYQKLLEDGFTPWLDEENLLPGQDWEQEIPNAVKRSEIVLVCLSKSSIKLSSTF